MKPIIFVSHISEEAELAMCLKIRIERDFLGMVNLFISSDGESIAAGSKWLESLETALKNAQLEIVLCSKRSVKQPWINFEAGAGWVKEIPIVPICHTDLTPGELPVPLNMLESLSSSDPADLEKLYKLIAGRVGCSIPSIDFSRFSAELKTLEGQYEKTLELADNTGKTTNGLELRSRAGDKEAIMQLSVSGRSDAFDLLVSILEGSPDEEVRAIAVSAIANLNDSRKTTVLGEVLLKERWTVASTCAQALGRSKDESAIPYLTKALDISVDWTVGQKSAEALSFFSPTKESTQALVRAMNRGESFTSEAAMQSLISYGDFAFPYVIKSLGRAKTFQSIENLVRVLTVLKDNRAIEELENAKKRIPEMDTEDRWKQQLTSQIDEAISAIQL